MDFCRRNMELEGVFHVQIVAQVDVTVTQQALGHPQILAFIAVQHGQLTEIERVGTVEKGGDQADQQGPSQGPRPQATASSNLGLPVVGGTIICGRRASAACWQPQCRQPKGPTQVGCPCETEPREPSGDDVRQGAETQAGSGGDQGCCLDQRVFR